MTQQTITIEARRAKAAESAARNVPNNPRPLCRDFQAQPEPAAFWCAVCHWNEPMHSDEIVRTAIAAELKRLGAAPAAAAEETHIVADDSDDPEHVDDCPGCEAFTFTGHVAAPAAAVVSPAAETPGNAS